MFRCIVDEKDFLIISKNAGVNFHSEDDEMGLVAAVSKSYGYSLYAVHRLDKITSGLIILAKSSAAAAQLSALFASRSVTKFYLAISAQKPKKKQGLIKGDMAKSRRGTWKLLQTTENPAHTQFFSTSLKPGFRLFILKPTTGKTHQIRVALKSLGAPVLGDDNYSGSPSDRAYLHAYSLRFTYDSKEYHATDLPLSGEHYLCEEFTDYMQKLESSGGPEALPWPK